MKSHEQRYADAVASLAARLESWNVEGAYEKAHEFVRDMLANGWRTTRWDLDPAPKAWEPGDATAGAKAAREALLAARGEGA